MRPTFPPRHHRSLWQSRPNLGRHICLRNQFGARLSMWRVLERTTRCFKQDTDVPVIANEPDPSHEVCIPEICRVCWCTGPSITHRWRIGRPRLSNLMRRLMIQEMVHFRVVRYAHSGKHAKVSRPMPLTLPLIIPSTYWQVPPSTRLYTQSRPWWSKTRMNAKLKVHEKCVRDNIMDMFLAERVRERPRVGWMYWFYLIHNLCLFGFRQFWFGITTKASFLITSAGWCKEHVSVSVLDRHLVWPVNGQIWYQPTCWPARHDRRAHAQVRGWHGRVHVKRAFTALHLRVLTFSSYSNPINILPVSACICYASNHAVNYCVFCSFITHNKLNWAQKQFKYSHSIKKTLNEKITNKFFSFITHW